MAHIFSRLAARLPEHTVDTLIAGGYLDEVLAGRDELAGRCGAVIPAAVAAVLEQIASRPDLNREDAAAIMAQDGNLSQVIARNAMDSDTLFMVLHRAVKAGFTSAAETAASRLEQQRPDLADAILALGWEQRRWILARSPTDRAAKKLFDEAPAGLLPEIYARLCHAVTAHTAEPIVSCYLLPKLAHIAAHRTPIPQAVAITRAIVTDQHPELCGPLRDPVRQILEIGDLAPQPHQWSSALLCWDVAEQLEALWASGEVAATLALLNEASTRARLYRRFRLRILPSDKLTAAQALDVIAPLREPVASITELRPHDPEFTVLHAARQPTGIEQIEPDQRAAVAAAAINTTSDAADVVPLSSQHAAACHLTPEATATLTLTSCRAALDTPGPIADSISTWLATLDIQQTENAVTLLETLDGTITFAELRQLVIGVTEDAGTKPS